MDGDSKLNEKSKPRFYPEVENVLRSAGWFPGRVVDDAQLEQWLVLDWPRGSGIKQSAIFPAAYRFLREFGGLHVGESGLNTIGKGRTFTLDPLLALETGNDGCNWLIYQWWVESPLFPVGYAEEQEMWLAVDVQARLWMVGPPFLMGITCDQGLESLILGFKGLEIHTFESPVVGAIWRKLDGEEE